MNKGRKKTPKILIIILVFFLAISIYFNNILLHPSDIKIIKGESKNISMTFPFSLENEKDSKFIYNEDENILKKSYSFNTEDTNKSNVQVKLLGKIPVKNYNVNVVERPHLIPGGNSIGVSLNTKGVLVVAITDVIDRDGKRISPAKDAGLRVGDNIIEINGEKVLNSEHVVKILNDRKDQTIKIKISRNKKEIEKTALPIKSLQDNAYRLGIWIRDKTTGIGTLTYYNTEGKSFGALGHGITDVDTGKLLTVYNGIITQAKVSDIEHGVKGSPGELKGVFYRTDQILGNINKNNSYGIYGSINEDIIKNTNMAAIPIAFRDEVEKGKAHILTTLEGDKIEKFQVEILKLENQEKENQKSMVVKITDPVLLKKTGGIVQGMSGSPIIQNNKIVGAITHVFINDPSKGYGLYIEWMLNQENKF